MNWLGIAVLCRADPKFSGGCGGFDLYLAFSLLSYTPLAALALTIAGVSGLQSGRRVAVEVGLLAAVLAVMATSYVWEWYNGPLGMAYLAAALVIAALLLWNRRQARSRAGLRPD